MLFFEQLQTFVQLVLLVFDAIPHCWAFVRCRLRYLMCYRCCYVSVERCYTAATVTGCSTTTIVVAAIATVPLLPTTPRLFVPGAVVERHRPPALLPFVDAGGLYAFTLPRIPARLPVRARYALLLF